MNIINQIFKGIDTQYLIKSYVISGGGLFFILYLVSNANTGSGNWMYYVIYSLMAILFPFSAIVWDSIMELLFGNITFILPVLLLGILKILKIFALFFFSPFIAPIGIIYILFVNRKQ